MSDKLHNEVINSGEIQYLLKSNINGKSPGAPEMLNGVLDRLTKNDEGVIFEVNYDKGRAFCQPKLDRNKGLGDRNMSEIKTLTVGEHYYNAETKQLSNNFSNSDGEDFTVFEFVDLKDIQFTSTRKQIGSYQCLKAIHTQFRENPLVKDTLITEIWYTPEINLPFGPSKYVGFPGLVVQVSHKAFEYKLIHIIERDVTPQELTFVNFNDPISKEQYTKRQKKSNNSALRKIKEMMDAYKRGK
jgi:GLPGLI family protein